MQVRTIYLIKRVETEITAQMSKVLSAFDITPLQFTVLSFVDTNSSDFSSAQLSRRFLMTPQSMNEIVAILQRKNMIHKTIDPKHRRVLRLSLTEQGKDVLAACNAAIDTLEQDLFNELSREELTNWRAFLGKILKKIRTKAETLTSQTLISVGNENIEQ